MTILAYASAGDALVPLSESGHSAAWLRDHDLGRAPMVGDRDSKATAVAALLDRPIRFATTRREGRFVVFNAERDAALAGETVARARLLETIELEHAAHPGEPVVVLLSYPLEPPVRGLAELARFPSSGAAGEGYWIYLSPAAPRH